MLVDFYRIAWFAWRGIFEYTGLSECLGHQQFANPAGLGLYVLPGLMI